MPTIPQLPVAAALTGTELFPLSQSDLASQTDLTTIAGWVVPQVNLFRFMTNAQIANVQAGLLTVDIRQAILNAIAAYPGHAIYAPFGYYLVDGNIDMGSLGTWIVGEGAQTRFYQGANNTDTFRLRPPTAGTTAAFGYLCGIRNVAVYHTLVAPTSTSGAAIRVTQMDAWRLLDNYVADAPEGVAIEGGQAGILDGLWSFATAGSYQGLESALIHFKAATYGAGQTQHMFTTEVHNLNLSGGGLRETAIRIADCDGLHINSGYANNGGGGSLMKITGDRNTDYIASFAADNLYLDGLGTTNIGLNIANSGFTNNVFHVTLGKGMNITNCNFGVVGRSSTLQAYRDSAQVSTCTGWSRDIEAGASTVIEIDGTSRNCGSNGASGDLRLVGSSSLAFALKGFTTTAVTNVVLNLSGTWKQGLIGNCTNTTNVQDIVNTATFTTFPLTISNNTSAYTGGTPATSWASSGTWTPSLTFATPGNLAITSYPSRIGTWAREGRTLRLGVDLSTSGYTQTTASGNLQLTGMGFTFGTAQNWAGALEWSGITKAGYSQICLNASSGGTLLEFQASGSGVARTSVVAGDVPTGGTISLRGEISVLMP